MECHSIPHFTFNNSSGELRWDPTISAFENGSIAGKYEFKISGRSRSGASESIFNITITNGPGHKGEWVYVPANFGGFHSESFYIMKFEAKAWNDLNLNNEVDLGEVDIDGINGVIDNWAGDVYGSGGSFSHVPLSTSENLAWREIDIFNAKLACESIGTNYFLNSNQEWMILARDIENVDTNWTGGAVGSGCLRRGNSGDITVGTGTSLGDSCGYNGSDPEGGNETLRDIRAGHELSTGADIFDLAGNSYEWIDWDRDDSNLNFGPTTCTQPWQELNLITCPEMQSQPDAYLPENTLFTSVQGMGGMYGGPTGAAVRGGPSYNPTLVGIYRLDLDFPATFSHTTIGFRCVYRP